MTSQALPTSSFRVWIGCLSAYKSGILHGECFDVSDDADENAAHIAKVLRASPCPNVVLTDKETGEKYASAEEAFCADYEGPHALTDLLGEFPSAQKLADAARLFDALSEWDDGEGAAILDEMIDRTGTRDPGKLADEFEDWVSEHFAGKGDTLAAWCEEYLEETDTLSAIPENLRNYFDFEAFARDMKMGGDVSSVRVGGSVLVFWNR